MTFHQVYGELEQKIECMIEEENTIFLPFLRPKGPVDFVLVGMESSLGGWAPSGPTEACEKRGQGMKHFAWSMEDFILHYCIRNYLCPGGETYYLTDLAKGAMFTKEAADGRRARYEKWYPILEEEIGLIAKPEAKIISIGTVVGTFLSAKALYRHAGTILHYSPQAARHRGLEGKSCEEYKRFTSSVELCHVLQTAEKVLEKGEVCPSLKCEILKRLKKSELSDSRKRLMFNYKVRFDRIRCQAESGWPHWQSKLVST